MLPYIRAVIFDLDGVIINSNPAIEAFWTGLATRENIALDHAMMREWVHGRKATDTVAGVFGHLNEAVREAMLQDAAIFDHSIKADAITGAVAFIHSLNRFGIPTGVVTSSHHSRMMQFLMGISVHDKFTHFVTAHDVTQGKPHPQPYQKMSECLNIAPDYCLVFEDAISGIQSARAAGMHVIGIGDDHAQAALVRHGALDVIPDFSMLRVNRQGIGISDKIIVRFCAP